MRVRIVVSSTLAAVWLIVVTVLFTLRSPDLTIAGLALLSVGTIVAILYMIGEWRYGKVVARSEKAAADLDESFAIVMNVLDRIDRAVAGLDERTKRIEDMTTVQFPRPNGARVAVYAASAPVPAPVEEPPIPLPSADTVDAMRRLARKITRLDE